MEVLSRRLFIGLGRYGSLVAERLRQKLADGSEEARVLSAVLDFQAGAPPFSFPETLSRRAVRAEFVQGDVCRIAFDRIDEAVSACGRMPKVRRDAQMADNCLCVFVIADLAEPFAGAIFLDIARMAEIATLGRERSIMGILGLGLFPGIDEGPDRVEHRAGYCNVCAALRELDHVLSNKLGEEFNYASPIPHAPPSKVFDQCFLFTDSNRRGAIGGQHQHARCIARFLYDFCSGEFLRKLVAFPRNVQSSATTPARPLYSSLGLATAFFPRKGVHAYCMERWARDVKDSMTQEQRLAPLPPDADTALQKMQPEWSRFGKTLDQLIESGTPHLSAISFPGQYPSCDRDAAEFLLESVALLERESQSKSLPSALKHGIDQKLVDPLIASCKQAIKHLLENNTSGIGMARALLTRIHNPGFDMLEGDEEARPLLAGLIPQSRLRYQEIRERTEAQISQYRERLDQVLSTSGTDKESSPPPSWLLHPIRHRNAVKAERDLKNRIDQRVEDLETIRKALREKMTSFYSQTVLEELAAYVEQEKHSLDVLEEKLDTAARTIGEKYRAGVPEALGVDKALVAEDDYEVIYADCLQASEHGDVRAALEAIIIEKKLLKNFRRRPAEAFTEEIETFGGAFFERIPAMGIDESMANSQISRTISGIEDILKGLWDIASPLIDTSGALLPGDWNIAETSGISLPDADRLRFYSPSLAHSVPSPSLFNGSKTCIAMCRVIHGFTLDTIKALKYYVSSYDSLDNKSDVHILEWIDQLPQLPSAD